MLVGGCDSLYLMWLIWEGLSEELAFGRGLIKQEECSSRLWAKNLPGRESGQCQSSEWACPWPLQETVADHVAEPGEGEAWKARVSSGDIRLHEFVERFWFYSNIMTIVGGL